MAKAKKTSTKTSQPVSEASRIQQPRRLKTQQYQRWKFQKIIKHPGPKLISSWTIFRHSLGVIKRNKNLFGGILAVYAVLSLILVGSLNSGPQLSAAKATLQANHSNALGVGTTLIGNLFNSSNGTNASGSTYQSVLFLIMSLVIIWALRQAYLKDAKPVSVKDAFYKSMTPLVPFVLVMLFIALELLPLVAGSTIYGLVVGNGLALGGAEQLIWTLVFIILSGWSLYMISLSLFALYIVTLPGVQPIQALRSAKQLVQFRRWEVMRKVLFLPIILLVLLCIIMLPVVLLLTAIAQWIFFVLSLSMIIVGHSYFYNLYRELM